MARTFLFPVAELRLDRLLPAAAAAIHVVTVVALDAVRWEHLVLDGLLAFLALAGPRAWSLAATALPLWAMTVLYLDVQPLLLPLRGPVHAGDLFALDAALFPAPGAVPWPAFFSERPHPAADLAAGLAYALYLVQFVAVLLVLLFRRRERAQQMAWAFLVVNAIGIAIYILVPAAPPWYILDHGTGPVNLAVAPSAAGAARFDALLGIGYFEAFYSKNPNVFGAMPSLHAAYPAVAAIFLWREGPLARTLGVGFALWVAVSAVYLAHHYVLDVVVGITAAFVAAALVQAGSRLRRPVPSTDKGTS